MPYPEPLVAPMRAELTSVGVTELKTASEVDQAFEAAADKTMLLIVNSVCGCAAAMARPAVRIVFTIRCVARHVYNGLCRPRHGGYFTRSSAYDGHTSIVSVYGTDKGWRSRYSFSSVGILKAVQEVLSQQIW